MATPYIRAKANDNADAFDNLTAYLDPTTRSEIAEYIAALLADIGSVIADAREAGVDPAAAYQAFAAKFDEYCNAPAER